MTTPEKAKPALPFAVQHFGTLPSEARIDSKALKILLGINSDTTFWRRRESGVVPPPDKFGTWSVGTVRKLLCPTDEHDPNEF